MSTDSTPILSKWVDNGHLTFDRVLTKKNWVNESFVTRRWFPIHQMFYSPIMPRALSLPRAGSLYWRDRKTFLYFMVGSPSGNDIVSDRAVSGESGIRNHNAVGEILCRQMSKKYVLNIVQTSFEFEYAALRESLWRCWTSGNFSFTNYPAIKSFFWEVTSFSSLYWWYFLVAENLNHEFCFAPRRFDRSNRVDQAKNWSLSWELIRAKYWPCNM